MATSAVVVTDATSGQGADQLNLPSSVSAAAFMAIVGILLVGLFLVAVVLLGGRWARRQANARRQQTTPPDRPPLQSQRTSAQSADPIRSRADDNANDDAPNDTVADDPRGSGETMAS